MLQTRELVPTRVWITRIRAATAKRGVQRLAQWRLHKSKRVERVTLNHRVTSIGGRQCGVKRIGGAKTPIRIKEGRVVIKCYRNTILETVRAVTFVPTDSAQVTA